MATALTPINEKENEEIAMYNQIVTDALSVKPDWNIENLSEICGRVREHLASRYSDLSPMNIEKIVSYFAYYWE